MPQAIYARTKFPNTPETDRLGEVMHIVKMSDGRTVEIMAADPMDAIEKVNRWYLKGGKDDGKRFPDRRWT